MDDGMDCSTQGTIALTSLDTAITPCKYRPRVFSWNRPPSSTQYNTTQRVPTHVCCLNFMPGRPESGRVYLCPVAFSRSGPGSSQVLLWKQAQKLCKGPGRPEARSRGLDSSFISRHPQHHPSSCPSCPWYCQQHLRPWTGVAADVFTGRIQSGLYSNYKDKGVRKHAPCKALEPAELYQGHVPGSALYPSVIGVEYRTVCFRRTPCTQGRPRNDTDEQVALVDHVGHLDHGAVNQARCRHPLPRSDNSAVLMTLDIDGPDTFHVVLMHCTIRQSFMPAAILAEIPRSILYIGTKLDEPK
jgi:hypothetical protein